MLRGSQPDLLLRAGKPEILPDRHGIFRLPGSSFFNRFAPKNDTSCKNACCARDRPDRAPIFGSISKYLSLIVKRQLPKQEKPRLRKIHADTVVAREHHGFFEFAHRPITTAFGGCQESAAADADFKINFDLRFGSGRPDRTFICSVPSTGAR